MKEEKSSLSLSFLRNTVASMAGKVSSARKGLQFLKLGHNSKPLKFRIVVLGAEEVGKTALIVRYLTKRYLHEYIRGELLTYERQVTVEDREYSLFFYDTPGTTSLANLERPEIMGKIDGYVVVYSITDRKSFITGKEMVRSLYHGFEVLGPTPVCLLGNKQDLNHLTKVTHEEGENLIKSFPNLYFRQCSAADGLQSVEIAFNEFFKSLDKRKDNKKKHSSSNNTLTVNKSPSPRRHSAGNSALSHWWRRPRSSSACERQDRTYTM